MTNTPFSTASVYPMIYFTEVRSSSTKATHTLKKCYFNRKMLRICFVESINRPITDVNKPFLENTSGSALMKLKNMP